MYSKKYNSVTVGITAFNAENTILRALNSALLQTHRPIEIIIIDDFSTDGTFKKILNAATQYQNIKVFKNNKNYGVAFSRNKIIRESSSDFLIFFDDDDFSYPERIQEQLDRIVNYEKKFKIPPLVICHAAREVIYPDNQKIIISAVGENIRIKGPSGRAFTKRILLGDYVKNGFGSCATSSQMARLNTYKSVGGFDIRFRRSEDTDLNIRLAESGCHFIGISKPLVKQYMLKKSWKSLNSEYQHTLLLFKKYKYIFDEYGQYYFSKKWIFLKYRWLNHDLKAFFLGVVLLSFSYPLLTFKRIFFSLISLRLNFLFSFFYKA